MKLIILLLHNTTQKIISILRLSKSILNLLKIFTSYIIYIPSKIVLDIRSLV